MQNSRLISTLTKQITIIPLCFLAFAIPSFGKVPEKTLSPAETALEYEGRSLNDPLFKAYAKKVQGQEAIDWSPNAWDLEFLTLAAFYYHPDLDIARAQWKTTLGGIDNARSRPNALLQSQARYSINPAPGLTPWYLQLFSGFVIETAGKRHHRIEQAKALSEASRARIGQTAWLVRSRLRSTLVNTLSALERLEVLKEQQSYQQDVLKGIQHRVAVGESSPLEATQTQILLEQIQLQIQEAERQRLENLALVAQAVGIPVDTLRELPLTTSWFDHRQPLSDVSRMALRREALLGRAEILALMQEYQASHEALKLAISQRYPDIRVGPGFLWNQGQKFWALPLDLGFPTHLSTKGAVKEALARRSEVAARFTALQAQVIAEVERGYMAYEGALEKVSVADSLLNQQERRRQILQKQLEVGEVDRLALRLAEIELQTAKLNQLDSLTQAQQALGLLEDSIQRPLTSVRPSPEDLQAIPRLGQTAP